MKRRFAIHKKDLVVIHRVLAASLKTCKCYWGDLDSCSGCKEVDAIVKSLKPIVETYLGKQAPEKGNLAEEVDIQDD